MRLLKVGQPGLDKRRVRVGVDKSGQDHLTLAVDFDNAVAVFLPPRIANGVRGLADRDDLAAQAKYGAVFDDGKFFQRRILGAGRAARRERSE